MTPINYFKHYIYFLTGNKKLNSNFITIIKSHDHSLDGNLEVEAFEGIKKSINVHNVTTYYQIAKYFNLTQLSKQALCYIEQCFTTVFETHNFLELNYILVAKVLASSNLHLDSELEVLKAVDYWVNYSYYERSNLAQYLLSKIRLFLLPDHALNSITNEKMSLNKTDLFVDILREMSQNKKICYQKKSNVFYTSRFSCQNMFNLIVSGGIIQPDCGAVKRIQLVDGENLQVVKLVSSMKSERYKHNIVYCKCEVYVFGGYDINDNFINRVDKYSVVTSY